MHSFNASFQSVSNRQTKLVNKNKQAHNMEKTETCGASGYESKCFKQVITLIKCLGEGLDADTPAGGVSYAPSSN